MTVQEAAERATSYFQELLAGKITDIWLEEVELVDGDPDVWRVTLSALAPGRVSQRGLAALAGKDERIYRVFEIHDLTGRVLSMKIRTVQ